MKTRFHLLALGLLHLLSNGLCAKPIDEWVASPSNKSLSIRANGDLVFQGETPSNKQADCFRAKIKLRAHVLNELMFQYSSSASLSPWIVVRSSGEKKGKPVLRFSIPASVEEAEYRLPLWLPKDQLYDLEIYPGANLETRFGEKDLVIRQSKGTAIFSDFKLNTLASGAYLADRNVGDFRSETVVYKEEDGVQWTLELDLPEGYTTPRPVYFSVHGGGWAVGDPSKVAWQTRFYAARGIAGARIRYHLIKEGGNFEIVMQDLRDGLAWLRAHASEYNLDMNRLVVGGGSAGAHLSSNLAVRDKMVDGFIGFVGLYDVVDRGLSRFGASGKYFGGNDDAFRRNGSAIHQNPGRPLPAILFHGNGDATIDYQQSIRFGKMLSSLSNNVTVVVTDGGGHGTGYPSVTFRMGDVFMESLGFYDGENKQHKPGALPHPYQKIEYKKTNEASLQLHVFSKSSDSPDVKPAALLFHGGGWQLGSPAQLYRQANELSQLGMIVFVAEYRLGKKHGTTPFQSVEDAKSAMRWIRSNAAKLGVDPNRIAAMGGSAGGHLAAALATLDSYNAAGEDTSVSCKPNALVLFNPVVDNGPNGYGNAKIKEKFKTFSPFHNIKGRTLPPVLLLSGSEDALVKPQMLRHFSQKWKATGADARLKLYPGEAHAFFNYKNGLNHAYYDTLWHIVSFLRGLGYIKPI